MRKDMYNELQKGKQYSESHAERARQDLQAMNGRLAEMDAELRVSS